ncbi:MAG: TIGR04282 family arsenosugar biosynthesis glycosyltransferase [Bacteroidia bacterium]
MGNSIKKALLIFIKNPVIGKVKTRLASTIGNSSALKVYHRLLEHTRGVIEEVDNTDNWLFYSDYIPAKDEWNANEFLKLLQKGDGLGEKMKNAFADAFKEDFDKVLVISPDCPKLRPSIIENAYKKLDNVDVVIGPTEDGGYYMIGMNKLHSSLFDEKSWGSEVLFAETVDEMDKLGLKCFVFEKLLDVDREEDLGPLKKLIS